jgi:hypothetical protein
LESLRGSPAGFAQVPGEKPRLVPQYQPSGCSDFWGGALTAFKFDEKKNDEPEGQYAISLGTLRGFKTLLPGLVAVVVGACGCHRPF